MIGLARQLRADGLTCARIAETLGCTLPQAKTWVLGGECAVCGVPVTAGSKRCNLCRHRRDTGPQPWTRQRIVDAINAFYVQNGCAPTCMDWPRNTPTAPGHRKVTMEFGSMRAAVRAAGITPPLRRRGPDRNPRRLRASDIAPTVKNGFATEAELAYLIAQQEKDAQSRRVHGVVIDPHSFMSSTRGTYTDSWTLLVHHVVDRARQIDQWCEELAA